MIVAKVMGRAHTEQAAAKLCGFLRPDPRDPAWRVAEQPDPSYPERPWAVLRDVGDGLHG